MIFSKSANTKANLTILVAPLDWGLGHATRMIPVIEHLCSRNFTVIIAASGSSKTLLHQAFSEIKLIPIPEYKIAYSSSATKTTVKLLLQIPKILYKVAQEHFWLKRVVKKYGIDVVIADNRPGLFHKGIPTVYVTHQVNIQTFSKSGNIIAKWLHQQFIKKFNHCWIPDGEGNQSLAGALSHPAPTAIATYHLGCLSRFKQNLAPQKKYALVILISGPEPQRSIFEKIVLQQIAQIEGKVLLVRGLPNGGAAIQTSEYPSLTVYNHLASDDLQFAIQSAEWVLCRSGYTTIMDLVQLQQRAILVATPGQTEQVYLAQHLYEKKMFFSVEQSKLQLKSTIETASKLNFKIPLFEMQSFKTAIDASLNKLLHP